MLEVSSIFGASQNPKSADDLRAITALCMLDRIIKKQKVIFNSRMRDQESTSN